MIGYLAGAALGLGALLILNALARPSAETPSGRAALRTGERTGSLTVQTVSRLASGAAAGIVAGLLALLHESAQGQLVMAFGFALVAAGYGLARRMGR